LTIYFRLCPEAPAVAGHLDRGGQNCWKTFFLFPDIGLPLQAVASNYQTANIAAPGLPDGLFSNQKNKQTIWIHFGGPWNGKRFYI
jgi:hypothetical protein